MTKKSISALQTLPLRQERKWHFNRKHKDFLFRYILTDKGELLKLYNALNETNYSDETLLQITTLQDVVCIGYKNDLSFIIGNTLNLYEHQSTVNPNLPLRGLLYFSALYENYITEQKHNLYGRKRIELPTPQYVVFYNGKENTATGRQELHLSDAYQKSSGKANDKVKPCLELTATVLNINYGQNKELLHKCRKLEEYAIFIEKVRHFQNQEKSAKKAMQLAMDDCIKNNILKDILVENKAKVMRMLLTEFDEKKYIAWERKDAMEEGFGLGVERGIEEGIAQGITQGIVQGEQRLNALYAYLSAHGLQEEMQRAFSDKAYRTSLLEQYGDVL